MSKTDEIKAKQEELAQRLKPGYARYFTCLNNLAHAHAEAREHEFACFDANNTECVQKHDLNRKNRYPVARARDKHFRKCSNHCSQLLPNDMSVPNYEAKALEEVQILELFVKCMQPCLDSTSVMMTQETEEIKRATVGLIAEFQV